MCIRDSDVTAPYGERHAGFSPRTLRTLVGRAGLDVTFAEVACREAKKPHFAVVLVIAQKSAPKTAQQAASPNGVLEPRRTSRRKARG